MACLGCSAPRRRAATAIFVDDNVANFLGPRAGVLCCVLRDGPLSAVQLRRLQAACEARRRRKDDAICYRGSCSLVQALPAGCTMLKLDAQNSTNNISLTHELEAP